MQSPAPQDDPALAQALSVLDARLDPASSAPLALGFSGGGDSLALLTLALDWAKPRGRRVLALSVDHRLQPESAAWTARAGEQAQALGADWRGLAWTGPKPQAGIAAAARRARHALLAEAARAAGASVLLLGHTADDVAEGERMRAEGSTLGRLREWAPSPVWPEGRGVFLLRPLLSVRRAALRAHLQRLGLDWIEDPANQDPRFARARARAALAGEAAEPPEPALAPALIPPAITGEGHGFGLLTLSRDALSTPLLLSAALVCAAGGERPPRGEALERLLQRLHTDDRFAATLAGARLEAGPALVHIFREPGEAARGGLVPIRLEPGRPEVWDGRFEITADEPAEVRPARGLAARLESQDRTALKALPPAARAGVPVLIRDAEPSPVLAGRIARVIELVRPRFEGACGVIAHEREIAGRTRGADDATSLC